MPAATPHTDRDHARFAPSASERWLACHQCVPFCEELHAQGKIDLYARKDTPYTLFGTLCHEIAEKHLKAWSEPKDDGQPEHLTLPNGEWFTAQPSEFLPHVQGYLHHIREIYAELDMLYGNVTMEIESRVDVVGKDCWGSVDVLLYAGPELYVIDLKTGSGHIVSSEYNTQFLTYAAGAMVRLGWTPENIHLARFQLADTDNPWDVWTCSPEDLRAHEKRVKSAIKAAKAGDGPFLAGEHCKWCPGKLHCTASQDKVLAVFDDQELLPAEAPREPTPPSELPAQQLAFIVEHRKMIADYLKAVEHYVITETLAGRPPVDNVKVVEGRSQRKWATKDEVALATELIDRGVEDPWSKKLISFTEAEKELGKGSIDDLVVKPPGKPSLAPLTDKRPALTTGAVFDEDAFIEDL